MNYIRELKVETIIGAKAWERQVRQSICLDLEFRYDMQQAINADSLAHAVDYHAVAQAVVNFVSAKSFILLETLAHELLEHLLQLFPLQWLKLNVSRAGALAQATEVGVVLERHSDGSTHAK